MSADLTGILNDWPYEAGKLNVRIVDGDDGEPRIQVRLDLGILQMYADGRPDGQTPHGFDSLLEFHEARLDEFEGRPGGGAGGAGGAGGGPGALGREHAETAGPDESGEADGDAPDSAAEGPRRFSLSVEECQALRDEAVQYYHRYMALLALEDFEGVVRDTTRNLRVLDLCHHHAQTENDRAALEQFRPYIMMVRARAMASQAIKDNEPKAALHAIDEGLDALRQYFADQGDPDSFDQSQEVQMLRGMRDALIPKLPVSQKSELKARLADAIKSENYELAAILRDELKQMKD